MTDRACELSQGKCVPISVPPREALMEYACLMSMAVFSLSQMADFRHLRIVVPSIADYKSTASSPDYRAALTKRGDNDEHRAAAV
ncbi:unnamed protein product [Heligmosomoides polygyrus]|uniref:Uncharacterized protein n=1 Tax=Heligmosomoides polygyrus TaxID=6339 RepID=A0A183FYJ2_HELPZ|nr:unnamed protein product [Heligmosomoides polygyrus]